MQSVPIPLDEKDRLKALHKMAILDTKPEERFDVLTREAVKKLKVAMSMVSVIDSDREWFKSCTGIDQTQGDRVISFCGHALLSKTILVIEDTLKDARFANNPMVLGAPFVRFYAGVPLIDHKTKQPVAVFCVKDTKPRKLSGEEEKLIMDLANRAEKELNADSV
ncbi:MAG: GAF domain-containing protein [Candidatus Pacebacteria bacterium]|nr:GAF domain-containing protein [Candidatus Paceibacterota bacterium]